MYNLKVHQRNKHGNQLNESQLKTSYMQGYPQQQPVHHGQVAHHQPIHYEQVAHQQPVQHSLTHNMSDIPHRELWSVQNQPQHNTLKHVMGTKNHVLQQDLKDSMDTDSVDLEIESVITDGEDEDEKEDDLNDLIKKIHYAFLDFKELRDQYRKALEKVENFDTEQMEGVLENYADLEVAILDEQDGVDPEENGDEDENVEGEGVDNNRGDEEGDTCTKCGKGCILDFVFELRDVIEDDEKETLENIIGEKKKEFLESKENENNDDSDDEEVELNTKSDIFQKDVKNVEEACDKFKENGSEYFKDCSKSKIQSVCEMCKMMGDDEAYNVLKLKYPIKYAHVNETINKLGIDTVRKLIDPQVTMHKKRQSLQKSQVGQGILNILKNMLVPELRALTNMK